LYLDMLDEMLRAGTRGLSAAFVDAQVAFVAACQQSDGGFRGRGGDSDSYYTDFALRSLALLAPDHAAFDRAANYLDHATRPVSSVVECFSLLSIRRTLQRSATGNAKDSGSDPLKSAPVPLFQHAVKGQLSKHLLPQGGFSRFDGDGRASAYHTFLGDLCFQMLGEVLPAATGAVRAVEALKCPDGGYAELDGQAASQTSATAAAVAFLTMHDALTPDGAAAAVRFLVQMQSGDGGLKPHAAAGGGDLLSTFTGLATLAALDGVRAIDTAGVAGFLRTSAHAQGGFLACAGDDSPDVEYTYYGVGIVALLRMLQ
jgi:geranylgeranyl transferase type-2 subunit beta